MIDQIAILVFGMTGVFLVNHPNPRVARYGCVCGLTAQPFWFWTSYDHAQWGVFLGTFVYCASWARGVYNNWLKPWRATWRSSSRTSPVPSVAARTTSPGTTMEARIASGVSTMSAADRASLRAWLGGQE